MKKTPPPRTAAKRATSSRQPQQPVNIQKTGPRPFFGGGGAAICGTGAGDGAPAPRRRSLAAAALGGAGGGGATVAFGIGGGPAGFAGPEAGAITVASDGRPPATVASISSWISTRKATVPKRSSWPFFSTASPIFWLST